MTTRKLLKVAEGVVETAQLEWLGTIPPITLHTITVSNSDLGSFELISHSELNFRCNNITKQLQVTPLEYFNVNMDFEYDDAHLYLDNIPVNYEIPFIIGESGEVFELGVDYFQKNDPKIRFELIEIEEECLATVLY